MNWSTQSSLHSVVHTCRVDLRMKPLGFIHQGGVPWNDGFYMPE